MVYGVWWECYNVNEECWYYFFLLWNIYAMFFSYNLWSLRKYFCWISWVWFFIANILCTSARLRKTFEYIKAITCSVYLPPQSYGICSSVYFLSSLIWKGFGMCFWQLSTCVNSVISLIVIYKFESFSCTRYDLWVTCPALIIFLWIRLMDMDFKPISCWQ